jgi:rhamnogalacturonan acetylesterase
VIERSGWQIRNYEYYDRGQPDGPTRARASLPGVGPETMEIKNPILKMHGTVHTYEWYIRKIVTEAKAKDGTPIVCSMIPRKTWKDGKFSMDNCKYLIVNFLQIFDCAMYK